MSEKIFDLLKDTDSSYCDNIINSKYTEGNITESINESINEVAVELTKHQNPVSYRGFITCILSELDPLYNNIPGNEKKMYLKKLVIDICSEIDEKPDIKYHNYKFNESVMKTSLLQYSLQSYDKNVNYISSIYYLNEYYQKHFVICHKGKMYETSLRGWPRLYLHCETNKKVHMTNEVPDNHVLISENEFYELGLFENDISKSLKQSYKMPLSSIGKYKICDLKIIALENNISLFDDYGKKKTKNNLYDELNLYLLNV